MRGLIIGLCLLALAAGCSQSESVLARGARFPDDEGVVTDISLERMELEGKRRYRIAPEVESFRTRSHEPASLLSLKGKYVQVGLNDDGQIEWIALIGLVTGGEQQTVIYTGVFDRIDRESGRVVFADGTTLGLAGEIDEPDEGQEVAVTIDVRSHRIAALQVATLRSTPAP